MQESSIFAYEGPHAIDAEFEKLKNSAAREYRAKLSEIAFAPVPRLAFSGILTDNIGNGSPHGQANLKLMKGLVAWMEEHRSEIAGLDGSRPQLPQLDKLTNDQLRAAARSLDPMAAPSKSTLGEGSPQSREPLRVSPDHVRCQVCYALSNERGLKAVLADRS